jgi:hypothetical protein
MKMAIYHEITILLYDLWCTILVNDSDVSEIEAVWILIYYS